MNESIWARALRTAARTFAVAVLVATPAFGCGGGKAAVTMPRAPPKHPLTEAERAAEAEALEQRDAQRSWCGYLQALYMRAGGSKSWAHYPRCLEVTTLAAPKLLRRTADCSLRALQGFQGDPFTAEYAAEVSRCGSDALDAMAAPPREIAPFVATICGRLSTCGNVDYGDCQESLVSGLGAHLERAIGAINSRGRNQLRACFKKVTCDELGTQITTCLEPIMDDLLWLPS